MGNWGQATATNMVYTKLGSTVGFTYTGTATQNASEDGAADTWDADDVVFNPTSTTNASYGVSYGSILYHNTDNTSEGYISSSAYHTLTNVKAGRGDICQLVGLSGNETRELDELPKPKYRLPTNAEQSTFVGYTGGVIIQENILSSISYTFSDETLEPNGSPRTGTFDSNPLKPTLPMDGNRHRTDGSPNSWGRHGNYWSSTPLSATDGNNLDLATTDVWPSRSRDAQYGFSIRCVRSG